MKLKSTSANTTFIKQNLVVEQVGIYAENTCLLLSWYPLSFRVKTSWRIVTLVEFHKHVFEACSVCHRHSLSVIRLLIKKNFFTEIHSVSSRGTEEGFHSNDSGVCGWKYSVPRLLMLNQMANKGGLGMVAVGEKGQKNVAIVRYWNQPNIFEKNFSFDLIMEPSLVLGNPHQALIISLTIIQTVTG
jgi:hypothetical protein